MFKNVNKDFNLIDETIVCIDALDEVAISNLYDLLDYIREFIESHKKTKVLLSCRTHHIKKIDFDFDTLDFKFITLSQFSMFQIEHFLQNYIDKDIDLDTIYKKSKISNLSDLISQPRYLYYFSELLGNKSVEEIVKLSRAAMFEYFIYRKLDKELNKNTPQSQKDLIKRVLEKLAFIMKLYGVSEITKDELMTIFDKLDSNFSQISFKSDLIEKFYDRSLIKDNIDTIEFENQWFLDYLSAKELVRFEKAEQVFFDIAFEPHLLEVYPSWFYVMPFIFEAKPEILNLFIEFLNKNKKRVFSNDYFQALLNIEPTKLTKETRSKIFDVIFDYYTYHTKWFDSSFSYISKKLFYYYYDSKYEKIVALIDGRKIKGDRLIVLRSNAIRLVSLLINYKKLDKEKISFWQKKVSKWLKLDVKKYCYLHQSILTEFANLSNGDFEWIKKHRFIFENGIKVQDEYARACFKIAPNDKFSIDIYLKTDEYWTKNKEDENLARFNEEYDYILKLSSVYSMMYALEQICNNKSYYHHFCDNLDRSIYEDRKIDKFKENLLNISNDKFINFLKKLVVKEIKDSEHHLEYCHGLYQVFIEVILQHEKNYIKEYISICENYYKNDNWYFHFSFLSGLSENFIVTYFKEFFNAFEDTKDKEIRLLMIERLYYKIPNNSIERENIVSKYPDIISKNSNTKQIYEKKQTEKFCKKWENKIEPKPNNFLSNLFEFFIHNKENLKNCKNNQQNYEKMVEIAKDILKTQNPLVGSKVKHESYYTKIRVKNYYKSCIEFVYQESIKIDQKMQDNAFRYLPFCINGDYDAIFKLAKNPSKSVIEDIVNVYAGERDDDLGVFRVRNFVDLYNKMKLSQFEPILLKMLENDKIEEYEKVYIIQSLPKDVLTVSIIKENQKKLDKNSVLYREYLSTLISKHSDKKAIDEAYSWVKKRAKEIKEKGNKINSLDYDKNNIVVSMANSNYDIKRDKELLRLSSKLNDKGSEFLKRVVEIHLEYLVKNSQNAHKIILDIEKFIDENRANKNLHWFEYRLEGLKNIYLDIKKSKNIVSAIKKYNDLSSKEYLAISSSYELFELLKDIIESDIRLWIESEGAYKLIEQLSRKKSNTNAEDFIQKTIKSQIELALLKRGFRATDFNITREEQLLDDKRLDFTIRYGFIGSVMIELKLSRNSEAKANTKDGKKYIEKIKNYMKGSNSDYGLFVIFNIDEENNFSKQVEDLNKLYSKEDDIGILGLNCV